MPYFVAALGLFALVITIRAVFKKVEPLDAPPPHLNPPPPGGRKKKAPSPLTGEGRGEGGHD